MVSYFSGVFGSIGIMVGWLAISQPTFASTLTCRGSVYVSHAPIRQGNPLPVEFRVICAQPRSEMRCQRGQFLYVFGGVARCLDACPPGSRLESRSDMFGNCLPCNAGTYSSTNNANTCRYCNCPTQAGASQCPTNCATRPMSRCLVPQASPPHRYRGFATVTITGAVTAAAMRVPASCGIFSKAPISIGRDKAERDIAKRLRFDPNAFSRSGARPSGLQIGANSGISFITCVTPDLQLQVSHWRLTPQQRAQSTQIDPVDTWIIGLQPQESFWYTYREGGGTLSYQSDLRRGSGRFVLGMTTDMRGIAQGSPMSLSRLVPNAPPLSPEESNVLRDVFRMILREPTQHILNPSKTVEVNVSFDCTGHTSRCQPGQIERPGGGCTRCSAGTYPLQDRCVPCPAGLYGSDGTRCLPCPVGRVGERSGTVYCRICPINTYASGVGGIIVQDGAVQCTPCSPRTFAPNPGSGVCLPCLSGHILAADQTRCVPCPAGTHAPRPHMTRCIPCPPGTYAPQGSSRCVPCPSGHASTRAGSEQCQECPAGTFTFLQEGASACMTCPAGYYAGNPRTLRCSPCPAGYYSQARAIHCRPCASSTYSPRPGMGVCLACPTGHTSRAGSTQCSPCSEGSAPSADQLRCEDCPPGKYAHRSGLPTCQLCPPGTSSSARASRCTPCSSGTYAPQPGSSRCLPCPAGSITEVWQDGRGNATCLSCGPGKIAVNGRLCRRCPPGTSAPPGVDVCQPCPRGEFAVMADQFCQPCSPGTYTDATGQSACRPCPAGTFAATRGTQVCQPCPAGTSSDTGATTCYRPGQCPTGTFQSSGSMLCLECPPGQFSATPQAQGCQFCPAGSYQPNTSASSCLPCPPGSVSGSGASTCTPCPSGQIPNQERSRCEPCPAGSNTPHFGTGNVLCVPCMRGTAGVSCAACARGTVATSEGSTSCSSCPGGTYTGVREAAVACLPCESGKIPTSDRISCDSCPQGTITAEASCRTCPAGTTPSPNQTECTSCPPGSRLPDNSTICVPCPAGTASDINNTCARCHAGTYSPEGSSACLLCPPGTFARPGSTSCTPCPQNHFASAAQSAACLPCPSGTRTVQAKGASACVPQE